MRARIIGLAAVLIVVAGLAGVASGLTGANSSSPRQAAVAGTLGKVTIATSGGTIGVGDGINFSWEGMLPGTVYTAPITIQNTSDTDVEDVWMVFPNLTALSALNSLGQNGAVTIDVQPSGGATAAVFESNNLNDNAAQGSIDPAHLWPVPAQQLLVSNVAPGAVVHVIFKFEYASALTKQPPAGTTVYFNTYPVPASTDNPHLPGDAAGYAQVTVNPADGSGNGLPFEIAANTVTVTIHAVHVTGTVTGKGGTGAARYWWTERLSGATVQEPTYSASTTTAATGTYALDVPVPGSAAVAGLPINVSTTYYKPTSKQMTADSPQVVDFSLRVLATTIVLTVKHSGRPVSHARIAIFHWLRFTNIKGHVTLKGLGLKPLTKYTMTIKKAGLKTLKFQVMSRPGGRITISKRL